MRASKPAFGEDLMPAIVARLILTFSEHWKAWFEPCTQSFLPFGRTTVCGFQAITCVVLSNSQVMAWNPRSEEHTSELQSRVDLVCRLLLEKKKERQNKK